MKYSEDNRDIVKIDISQSKLITIFLASFLFYIIAIILCNHNTFDCALVLHFNYVYENEFILRFFRLLSHFGIQSITLLYVLFLILSIKKDDLQNETPLLYLIVISLIIAGISGDLLKEVFDKARPAILLSGQVSVKSIHETPGFPSGHATKSMALTMPFILMASRKNYLIFVFKLLLFMGAISVCYSRIALQSHFLSDILAGIGTVLFFLPITVWLTNRLFTKFKINITTLNHLSQKTMLMLIFLALTFILFFW